MRDDDGGLSLISAGIRCMTTAEEKQNQIQQEIVEDPQPALQLSRGWVVDPDANVDRERRIATGHKIVDWLMQDQAEVYYRVHALQESLGVREGDELELADSARGSSAGGDGDPLPTSFKTFSASGRPCRVGQAMGRGPSPRSKDGAPWIAGQDFNSFTRYPPRVPADGCRLYGSPVRAWRRSYT